MYSLSFLGSGSQQRISSASGYQHLTDTCQFVLASGPLRLFARD
jgi:hypothetical protein